MLDPNLIAPQAFAGQAQTLSGSFRLNELDGRLSSHEYLADQSAAAAFSLRGGKDRWQRPYADLSVQAELSLYCQRCLQPMPYLLDESVRIVWFADEEKLDEAMLADEELEGMVMSEVLDVRGLVEDQILMAMPLSPRHEDCGNEVLSQVNQDRPNPFAVLAGLKSNT
ncbi:DUF177 domain-containing protein [Neisseria leonii]|uniref:YceD family protein n=1 Tax=Neisseria leonii TaxID=2995413 RepID=UPI00237BBA92|nr:YceD family protein [Neisseria sp. 3986]MDD9326149.1 YceD family protein [Neisseria sp. 3986]